MPPLPLASFPLTPTLRHPLAPSVPSAPRSLNFFPGS